MTETPAINIRPLATHEEFAEAVRLQKLIWGFNEVELLPVRLFVVAHKIGGQLFGACDGERMVGFLLAMPGLKAGGKAYLHSHMLGVLHDYRNRGVGRLLKLRQREDALDRNIDLIEWTFDPLELKNAHFNIERLGAAVERYVLNQYGISTSHLHGGLPTDRCIANWHIATPRVDAILKGQPHPRPPVLARLAVPADVATIRHNDPLRARQIQQSVSEQFLRHLDAGLAATAFESSPHAGTYLFSEFR